MILLTTPWFYLGWLLLIVLALRWFHCLCVGADLEEKARSVDERRDEPGGLRAVS